jgi:hypothetical protein
MDGTAAKPSRYNPECRGDWLARFKLERIGGWVGIDASSWDCHYERSEESAVVCACNDAGENSRSLTAKAVRDDNSEIAQSDITFAVLNRPLPEDQFISTQASPLS